MEKRLRSLILEKFPFELRVEIELLSRRRDLINKDKHDELMNLLRKYEIDGIIPLGPGTNRYAFKLDGFVVKVATDNDGKIDNLKEFKMAKRLYPYVTKTYEVSENGTLLVAEYIQPFESYREMCMYSDKIKDILEKLSDVYLIGDVGITAKNYSNWGLRIGTEDPVCLDFAYVYEVKSELFICNRCKANAILVPTADFTKLQCSNPTCGQYYLFEDIRAKIGNDLHRHEIGDLSEEGYALTESGVLTELTEERSNYLKRKEPKTETKKIVKQETFVPDNFVMEHSPKYYIQHEEENSMGMERIIGIAEAMNRNDPDNVPILRGRVIQSARSEDPVKEIPVIKGRVIQAKVQELSAPKYDGIGRVAFEGSISESFDSSLNADIRIPDDEGDQEPVIEPPVVPGKVVGIEEPPQEPEPLFKKSFIDSAERAISQISNYGQITFHAKEIFDQIRTSIKGNVWPEAFYKSMQNAMYHSLLSFCNFTYEDVSTGGSRSKRVYKTPEDIENPKYAPTLLFIQRYWMNKSLQEIEDLGEMMAVYQEIYGEPGGFQREWLDVIKVRLMQKDKFKVDTFGITTILENLAEMWCVPEKTEVQDTEPTEDKPEIPEPVEDSRDDDSEEETEKDPLVGDFTLKPEESVVMQGISDEDEDSEYDEEDEDDTPDYITINIVHEDDFDIVKISCDDPYGYTSIPLYCDLEEIDTNPPPSLSDNRNGIWDWLIHMSPDYLFTTKDPERWLHLANDGELYQNQVHMAILDEYDNGTYLIGVSIVQGIYEFTDEDQPRLNLDQDLIAKINNLICSNIGFSKISHYARSCSMKDSAKDESYIELILNIQDSDEEDNEGDDPEMELTPAEKAALRVVMGTDTDEPKDNNVSDLKEAAAKIAEEIINGTSEEEPSAEPQGVPKVEEVVEEPKQEETPTAEEIEVAHVKASVPEPDPVPESDSEQKRGIFKPIHRM